MHEATAPPAHVWKSSGRLADGREIIYFDEAPGSGRAQVRDTRDLGGDFDSGVSARRPRRPGRNRDCGGIRSSASGW